MEKAMPYNTWSADTAASQSGSANADLDGLNVGEGCPAGNMNAAIRMVMSAVRQLWNVVSNPASSIYSTFLLKSGGALTGELTRDGRGGYAHYASPSLLRRMTTVQALGGAFPATPQEGDELLEY